MAKGYGLAGQIDGYLKGKASPLAGFGQTFVAAGSKYGVDPRLVVAISGAESGFGKHLFQPFNAWGWMSGDRYGSWDQSIATVTKGLADGYISQGLTTPAKIVSKYAPASAGNDEGVWSGNVATFLREMGAAPQLTTAKKRVPAVVPQVKITGPAASLIPSLPALTPSTAGLQAALQANLGTIATRGHIQGTDMLSGIMGGILQDRQIDESNQRQRDVYNAALASLKTQPTTSTATETPAGAPTGKPGATTFKVKLGQPIPAASLTRVGGEHGTSGLPGYPARDYFAPAGSSAVAPVSGEVIKLSGHDPALGAVEGAGGPLGWSVYIRGEDGKTYYLTHLGSRTVKVGETVKLGQQIGTVADYDSYGRPSHVHMGVSN